VTQKHCEGTLSELCSDFSLVWNLVLISTLWIVTNFTFFMPKFMMKYIPGSIYLNTFLSNFADSFSTISSYWIAKYLGRYTITFLFALSAIASIPLIFMDITEDQHTIWIPIITFTMSLGVAAAYANLFSTHMDNFPVVYNTTTFAFCGFMANFFNIFAPMVAEIAHPMPQLSFTLLNAAAFGVSLLIKPKTSAFY